MRAIIDKYRVPKIVLVDVAIILSLVMAFDPVVREFVFFQPQDVRAVGGHVAVNEIGQTDSLETGEPFYGSGAANDGELINAHHLSNPGGIEVLASDPDALAYVVDTDNNRVVYYELDYQCGDGCSLDGLLDSYPYGVMGQADFRTNTSGLTDSTLNGPTDILFANGYLFVTDTGNNRVLAFSMGENLPFVENAVADFVIGQADFESGDANQGEVTPQDYTLSGPQYLAYESSEKLLFVTDSGNNRVMVFDLDSIATGMSASYVLGQADFTSDGAATTQTGMDYPTGITLLDNGYTYGPMLFVSDTNNNRVLVFDARAPGSDLMSTIDPLWPYPLCDDGVGGDDDTVGIATGSIAACVLGQTDFTSSTGGLDDDVFSEPAALGVGYHRVYVGSYTDNRILAFDMDSTLPDNDGITNGESAVDIIGFDSYNGSDQCGLTDEAPCNTSVNEVRGIANYDFNNSSISIFVSDATHARVLQFNGVVNGPDEFTADGLLGQVDKDAVFGSDVDLFNTTSVISQWGLNAPAQLAHDSTFDTLYVADADNNRVMQYALDGNNGVNSRAATNVIGQGYGPDGEYGVEWYEDGTDFEYEGPFRSNLANWADEDSDTGPGDTVGNATDYNLSTPNGVVYGNNYLFVLDSDNARVQKFPASDPSTLDNTVAVTATDQRQLAYDSNEDRLFVPGGADLDEVTVYNAVTFGQLEHIGGAAGTPTAVAYDTTNDRLFVTSGNCILVYDASIPMEGQVPIGMLGDNDLDCTNSGTDAHSMQDPFGLAIDDTGTYLFVADTGNNRVLQFDVSTVGFEVSGGPDAVDVYGQDDFTSNSADTTQSSLSGPVSVLYLPTAQGIAVSDAGNNRVMFFTLEDLTAPAEHIATDLVGQLDGSDLPVFTTNDSDNATTELSARFFSVSQIVLDEAGHRLFVADAANDRVLIFELDSDNRLLDDTPDNVIGQVDFDTVDTPYPPTASSLARPEGIEYHDDNELLFVSEGNGRRVLVYDLSGGITDGMAATYVIGQTTFAGVTSAFDARHVEYPDALALDEAGNRLFVADSGSGHGRIMVFDVSPANLASEAEGLGFATNAVSLLGQTSFTSSTFACSASKFSGVEGLEYDSTTGDLYVAESGRVGVFDVDSITNGEDAVSVLGQVTLTPCTTGTTQTTLSAAREMVIKQGTPKLLYVADGDRIMVFDITVVTNGEAAVNVLGDSDFTGTEALNDTLGSLIFGMAYDTTNDFLLVSDYGSEFIRFYDLLGIDNGENTASVLGAAHRDFSAGGTSPEAESVTNEKGLWEPHDIALDPENDRLYVADFNNNRVLVFELTEDNELPDRVADYVLGQEDMTTKYAGTRADRMDGPSGLVADPENNLLYVADYWNHRVLVFDTSSLVNGQDADYVLGQSGFDNSTPGTTQTSLRQPRAVSLDPENGYLFVADAGNNRVLHYDVGLAGENLANGLAAAAAYGQIGFVSGSAGLSDTELDTPVGVFGDPNNEMVWIADYNNNRVVGYAYNNTNASFVLGQTDMSSNTGAASITGLNGPWDMELDDASQLFYISDANNNRVMVYDASDGLTDGEEAIDAYGQLAYDTSTSGTSDTEFMEPFGIVYDPDASTLWVADQSNNRVLAFGPDEQVVTGGSQPPSQIGFFPDRISINDDDANVDGYNVLVNIHAHFSEEFNGTVDVLLSNVPDFSTTIPFRYNIPDQTARKNWPKTVSWDLCFGLAKEDCDLGNKTVYARFYVNLPTVQPALTPIRSPNSNR